MSLDLDAIKARAEVARKVTTEWWEPWHSDGNRVGYYHGGRWFTIAAVASWEGGVRDESVAEFIAHAREDIPALVAEVERLRAGIADCSGSCQP